MSKQWPYYYYNHPVYHYPPPTHGMPYYQHTTIPKNAKAVPSVPKGEIVEKQMESAENTVQNSNPYNLNKHFEKIYEKLTKMEEENKQLKEKIENIKPITIENVNYKIQDLSVQELSGTLLVGLTTLSDAENLKRLLTENGPVKLNDMDTEDFEEQVETNLQVQAEAEAQNENKQNSGGASENGS